MNVTFEDIEKTGRFSIVEVTEKTTDLPEPDEPHEFFYEVSVEGVPVIDEDDLKATDPENEKPDMLRKITLSELFMPVEIVDDLSMIDVENHDPSSPKLYLVYDEDVRKLREFIILDGKPCAIKAISAFYAGIDAALKEESNQ